MTADVNVTEKVARALVADAARVGMAMGADYATRLAQDLLSVLADPEVLAGIAGVIHEAEMSAWPSRATDPEGGCMGGDRCRFVAAAVVEWLRGGA